MRIDDLKIFVDVVRYHSMNVASERNFTTPQNLSRIIKRMEDELGIVLFTRSIKGSDLTEDGERFYYHVIEILHQYDQALREIQGKMVDPTSVLEGKMRVSVFCSQGLLSYAVVNAHQAMQKEARSLILEQEIGEYETGKMIDHICEKEYDLVTIVILDKDLETITERLSEYMVLYVLYDDIVVTVNENNPLAEQDYVSIEDLKRYNMVAINNREANVALLGPDFSYEIMTNSIQSALGYIEMSPEYYILLGKSALQNYQDMLHRELSLRVIPFEKKKIATYVVLLHAKNLENKVMIDFVQKIARIFW